MPDLVGVFRPWDSDVFLASILRVEEAKVDGGGALGEEGKINAIAEPAGAERIRITEPNFNRSHKGGACLSHSEMEQARDAWNCGLKGECRPACELEKSAGYGLMARGLRLLRRAPPSAAGRVDDA